MKNKPNSKIIRIPLDKGKFSTINNSTLMNNTLSSDAKVLLQLLLNNTEEWNVNLKFYSDRFKWNGQKQAKVVKELKDNGYLNVTRFSKGNSNGFDYFYIISEYGNLNPDKEQTPQPTTQIKQESAQANSIRNNKEDIDQYIGKVTELLDEYGKTFTISEGFYQRILSFFQGVLEDENPVDALQFNEPMVRKVIITYIVDDKLDWIASVIDKQKSSLHGTQANKKKFITNTPKYFKGLFDSGKHLKDDEILIKVANQKYSILGYGGKKLPDNMD